MYDIFLKKSNNYIYFIITDLSIIPSMETKSIHFITIIILFEFFPISSIKFFYCAILIFVTMQSSLIINTLSFFILCYNINIRIIISYISISFKYFHIWLIAY